MAIEVLDVLRSAHAKNVVHRDIKPANLFVTRQGQVKVLDFGIARLRDETLGLKATGATLGTPAFMAPEQALALASEIDERTDLWALGATVFTMLSGCLVHAGDNARQVMVRAATEPARSLASVTPAVVQWVTKALSFDKQARWESAAAMRDAALAIHRDLFGSFQERYALRLFDTYAEDFATSPTLSPPSSAAAAANTTATSSGRSPAMKPDVVASPEAAPASSGAAPARSLAPARSGVASLATSVRPSSEPNRSRTAAGSAHAGPSGSSAVNGLPNAAAAVRSPSTAARYPLELDLQ